MGAAIALLGAALVVGAVVALAALQRQRLQLRDLHDEMARTQRTASRDRELADEARRRLAHALDAIPQAVLITDADGQVVFRNRSAEAFESARHSDALVEAAITDLVGSALAGHAEHRAIDLFGPPRRSLVISTTPLLDVAPEDQDPSGRGDRDETASSARVGTSRPALRGALAVVDDVSERRRLEATRRDFVANISHELRTPIGAVGLLAETLLAEDEPAVANRLAERIVTEAFRLARTVEDLLVLSTIESGETPELERVPIHQVVAEAVERIEPAAEQAGIAIEVSEPDRRIAIQGDRRQVTSALSNLLDNAVKYSDRGSQVEVSAGTDGVDVVIRVRDHGIGIPKADLERVFERFYRVDQARSRTTGGTGLGLAIVRHVATNHLGEVRVDSRLGEGSTFELILPSASGPVAVTDDLSIRGAGVLPEDEDEDETVDETEMEASPVRETVRQQGSA
jgi:two-component system sensor histidine kinase SenX3